MIGPGTLDASVTSSGTNTTIRLKNCVFLNRSSVPFKNTGIRYAFQGGAYLNFTNLDRPKDFTARQFEGFDGLFDAIRFKGPEAIKEITDLRFSYFPRHILPSKHEYRVEGMEKKDTETDLNDESFDFHLDPNRIRTVAEIQLFADVFSISFKEARRILTKAGRRCEQLT